MKKTVAIIGAIQNEITPSAAPVTTPPGVTPEIAPPPGRSMPELDLLVDTARNGNDTSFEKSWIHYQPKMLRYLSMFTRDAEDLCSEV